MLVCLFILMTSIASFAVTTSVGFAQGPFSVGDISISAFNNGNDVVLTGQDMILETQIADFQITDARGNNKGWMVRVSATPFEDANGNRLHEGALKISNLTLTAVGKSDPVDVNYVTPGELSLTNMPKPLIQVPESKGKGTYKASGTKLSLEVWPSEVLATTYTSTLTFELITNIK